MAAEHGAAEHWSAAGTAVRTPRPGRGKIERFFRTLQEQFLVEIDLGGNNVPPDPARRQFATVEALNDVLQHWLRQEYHARVHSETGEAPRDRYALGGLAVLPDPAVGAHRGGESACGRAAGGGRAALTAAPPRPTGSSSRATAPPAH